MGVQFVASLGETGSGHGQFQLPLGVAADAEGRVAVADSGNGRVQVFGADRAFAFEVTGQGGNTLNYPKSVAWGANGDLHVTDTYGIAIEVYSASGDPKVRFGEYGSSKTDPGEFNDPQAVGVGPQAEILVTDTAPRPQLFSSSGAYLYQWAGYGTGPGEFNYPGGIAVDADGRVYVTDRQNHRVQVFEGVFDRAARLVRVIGGMGCEPGRMRLPLDVAVGADGTIWVADTGNHRVQAFDSDGGHLFDVGRAGDGTDGTFRFVSGVSVLPDGGIVTADAHANHVSLFAPS